jgi:hypothetical protein
MNEYQQMYQGAANAAAQAAGVPVNIFSALIQQESSWNPYAVGTSGEYGFTQLMPGTAAQVNADSYITDPVSNLQGGANYLSSLYRKYGSWTDALAAYNAGTPSSTAGQAYASAVLSKAGVSSAPSDGAQTLLQKVNGWLYLLPAVGAVENAVDPGGQKARTQNSLTTLGTAAGLPAKDTTPGGFGRAVLVYGVAGLVVVVVTYFGIKALFDLRDTSK